MMAYSPQNETAEPVAWMRPALGIKEVITDAEKEYRIAYGSDESRDWAERYTIPLYLALSAPAPATLKKTSYKNDYERGCVDGWNECRKTMLAAAESTGEPEGNP